MGKMSSGVVQGNDWVDCPDPHARIEVYKSVQKSFPWTAPPDIFPISFPQIIMDVCVSRCSGYDLCHCD